MSHALAESEKSILQALAFIPDSRQNIFNQVRADDFITTENRTLFQSALNLWEANESLDNPTFQVRMSSVIPELEIPWWDAVQSLVKNSYRYNLLTQLAKAHHSIANNEHTTISEIRKSVQEVMNAVEHSRVVERPKALTEVAQEIKADLFSNKPIRKIPWGFAKFDMARLEPGVMAVLAARPRIGKTAFCCSFINNLIDRETPSAMFCFEMNNIQIATRLLGQRANVSYNEIRDRMFSSRERGKAFIDAIGQSAKFPCYLNCGNRMTMAQISDMSHYLVKEKGVKIIFIDYIQKVIHQKADSTKESVSRTSEGIKDLAQRLDIPIVACAQLNRDAENTRPTIDKIKECGDIEQDADIIFLMDRFIQGQNWRGRAYAPKSPEGIAVTFQPDLHCAFILSKNRNNPTGMLYLEYHGESMNFKNIKFY